MTRIKEASPREKLSLQGEERRLMEHLRLRGTWQTQELMTQRPASIKQQSLRARMCRLCRLMPTQENKQSRQVIQRGLLCGDVRLSFSSSPKWQAREKRRHPIYVLWASQKTWSCSSGHIQEMSETVDSKGTDTAKKAHLINVTIAKLEESMLLLCMLLALL